MVIRVWEAVVKLRSQEGQAEGCLTGTNCTQAMLLELAETP